MHYIFFCMRSYMKIKRLCVLAVLLTSSLAGSTSNSASKSEDKYYAGLNFGAGWGGGFKMKPGVVLGYHYDQNSKFELEVLSNIKSLKSIGASLLANYRFYPDLDIDPVKLYVSGGLGGYLQITPLALVLVIQLMMMAIVHKKKKKRKKKHKMLQNQVVKLLVHL